MIWHLKLAKMIKSILCCIFIKSQCRWTSKKSFLFYYYDIICFGIETFSHCICVRSVLFYDVFFFLCVHVIICRSCLFIVRLLTARSVYRREVPQLCSSSGILVFGNVKVTARYDRDCLRPFLQAVSVFQLCGFSSI